MNLWKLERPQFSCDKPSGMYREYIGMMTARFAMINRLVAIGKKYLQQAGNNFCVSLGNNKRKSSRGIEMGLFPLIESTLFPTTVATISDEVTRKREAKQLSFDNVD